MTYTISDLPDNVERSLLKEAERRRIPVERLMVEMIERGLNEPGAAKQRDLSDIAGTWVEDAQFDQAIERFERVDPDDWR